LTEIIQESTFINSLSSFRLNCSTSRDGINGTPVVWQYAPSSLSVNKTTIYINGSFVPPYDTRYAVDSSRNPGSQYDLVAISSSVTANDTFQYGGVYTCIDDNGNGIDKATGDIVLLSK
jgi:hypothetical protein